MRKKIVRAFSFLVAVYLFAIPSTCPGQSPPPPPPRPAKPIRVVGKAEVFYFRNSNTTKVDVGFTLLGSGRNSPQEDTFGVRADFVVSGSKVTRPESINFTLYSYTHGTDYRYRNENQVTIFLNDKARMSGTARPWFMNIDPRGGVTEYYVFSIPYDELLEMTKGNKVGLRLGNTKFDLTGDHIEALRDLSRAIE